MFSHAIDSGTSACIETEKLIGGARICNIFEEQFADALHKVNPLTGFTNDQIKNAIRNSTGLAPALGVPQRALEHLVKQQLAKLVEPSLLWVTHLLTDRRSVISNLDFEFRAKRLKSDLFEPGAPSWRSMSWRKSFSTVQTRYKKGFRSFRTWPKRYSVSPGKCSKSGCRSPTI